MDCSKFIVWTNKLGGMIMLAAEGLLNVLSTENDENYYEYCDNDHDFSEVLKRCGNHTAEAHTIRYANGEEKHLNI